MLTAGIDEVGRGCLAGPVIAAAVILDPMQPIVGLADSKKLSPKQRAILAEQIKTHALSWALGRAEPSEIDRINILQASLLAMQRAFNSLNTKPQQALVDGKFFPTIDCEGQAIIKGDQSVLAISAASILAKVARDAELEFYEQLFPGYGFAIHKGYPTMLHRQKLLELGLTPMHRRSFKPVREFMNALK